MILSNGSSRARGLNRIINNVSGNCGGVKKQGVPNVSINFVRVPKSRVCSRARCALTQVCEISTVRQVKYNRGGHFRM
jgi:hypothetical protein